MNQAEWTYTAATSACGLGAPSRSSAKQAATTGGITASLAITYDGPTSYSASVTVKNNGTAPAYNWQVSVNMHQSTILQGATGAENFAIGAAEVFTPDWSCTVLNPGASATFTFWASKTGSTYKPTINSVDGVASGAAGNIPDSIDHVARGVATTALQLAVAYENNKLPNTGDAHYNDYDGLLWSSQTYVVSSDGSQIQFDPNAPGYAFVPNAAKAELAFGQQDPSVASYLVAGLASCFADTNGQYVYNFNAHPLKGYKYSTTTQTVSMNASNNTGVDKVTLTGSIFNGGEQIKMVETQASGNDFTFGLVTSTFFSNFANTSSAVAKYHAGNGIPCSPFNGPGGVTSNPYLVMTLNGSPLGPRAQEAPLQCQNGNCISTVTIDPIAYASSATYYDANGNVVGPQPNPFTLDPTVLYGVSPHNGQYALNAYGQYGTFTTAVTLFGTTKYKYNLCGNAGSGC